jgi:rubrerythrin
MTRLIDADSIPWDVEGVGEIPVITKEEIDQMPTVDAVPVRHPVKHGKWIPREKGVVYPFWARYTCSECGTHWDDTLYCPNCGAKMDEDEID